MAKCNNCGRQIRFIKNKRSKTLIVNSNPIYFVPDPKGSIFVSANGDIRTGRLAADGIKGFTLHDCK